MRPVLQTCSIGLLVIAWSAHCMADPPEPLAEFGVLEGKVTYEGDIPRARIADNAGRRRDLLTVDRRTRGLQHVAVFLLIDADDDVAVPPTDPATSDEPFVIDQFEMVFVPHLVTLPAGSVVRFTNSDAMNHNVRSLSFVEANQFNVFTGAGNDYSHRFDADPRSRPAILSCDIHPWMRAWIFAFDHPWHTATDERGNFSIEGVPVGRHRVRFMQPDTGVRIDREITIRHDESTRLELALTEDNLRISDR